MGEDIYITGLEYFITALYLLLLIIGVTGNVCVLVLCAKLSGEAGMYVIYYASLALADLLLCGPCLAPQIWAHFHNHELSLTDGIIQAWGFLYLSCRIGSVLTLSIISFERLLAVISPHFYRTMGRRHALLLVALSWLLSALVGLSPYLWGGRYEYYDGAAGVGPDGTTASNISFMVVTELLALYLPTLVITVSVGVITCRVRGRWSGNKVTATLLTVLCVYLACFSVYFLFMLLYMTGLLATLPDSAKLYTQNFAFLALAWHSGCNPLVYALKASQFKEEIRQLENKAVRKYLGVVMSFRNGGEGRGEGSGASNHDVTMRRSDNREGIAMQMVPVKPSPRLVTRDTIL